MNARQLAKVVDEMREPDFVRRISNLRAATARAGGIAPKTAAAILDLPKPVVDLICAWQEAAKIEGQAHHMAQKISGICEGRRYPHHG
ncbi:hypothetical protein [Mesorhizobium sp. B1-1-7]|uniref:hypothetical protein n=1 Tax=Mesorhizobium sp. B1-1-7 TaxID=2589977 RepID=UPI00112B061B|nr:hypothetical protein [Mesorhizobium sp. B1-1-7]TPN49352.1 hypothetical protein FJ978_19335 [Mesorhizobium sp. B1-1-7]